MPPCKHSWCKDCNEDLNKFNINKCPICKTSFIPKLKKGKWIWKNNRLVWLEGSNDSIRKLKRKKLQSKIYNFYHKYFRLSYNRTIFY